MAAGETWRSAISSQGNTRRAGAAGGACGGLGGGGGGGRRGQEGQQATAATTAAAGGAARSSLHPPCRRQARPACRRQYTHEPCHVCACLTLWRKSRCQGFAPAHSTRCIRARAQFSWGSPSRPTPRVRGVLRASSEGGRCAWERHWEDTGGGVRRPGGRGKRGEGGVRGSLAASDLIDSNQDRGPVALRGTASLSLSPCGHSTGAFCCKIITRGCSIAAVKDRQVGGAAAPLAASKVVWELQRLASRAVGEPPKSSLCVRGAARGP